MCGLLCARAAHAQLEVTAYVGSYRPLTFLGSGDASPSTPGARDTVRHQNSITLGMRVTKWWWGRLAFEGRVGYAPSSLWSSGVYGGGPIVYPAHVWTSSAEALVRLTPPTARALLHVGGGVGLVGHGGEAYQSDTYNGPTTFAGGIAGVGAAIEEETYGHLGTVRHRSAVVEYRVEQHRGVLGDRLARLGLAPPVAPRSAATP